MIRGVPQRFGPAASALGGALVSVGRTEDAICLMEEALGVAQMIAAHRSLYLIGLGEAFLAAGRGPDALTAAEEGLAVARRHGERGFEARALRLLGAIHSGDGRVDAAKGEGLVGEAMVLATELGMRPLVAHCHLGLGKLYRRTGQHEQAQEHLTTATTMYRAMGMTYWLEKAEAEVATLEG